MALIVMWSMDVPDLLRLINCYFMSAKHNIYISLFSISFVAILFKSKLVSQLIHTRCEIDGLDLAQ